MSFFTFLSAMRNGIRCYTCHNNKILAVLVTIYWGQGEAKIFDMRSQGVVDISNYTFTSETTRIDFHANEIRKVPKDVFKSMPSLYYMELSSNLISVIENEAFIQVPSLQELHLYSNNLTCISNQMFSGLTNLRNIHLYNNQIFLIEKQSFAMMKNLQELLLSRNQLKSLSQSVFASNVQLSLLLDHNPIQCDLRLCWLKDGAEANWINIPSSPPLICDGPTDLYDLSWSSQDVQYLICHSK